MQLYLQGSHKRLLQKNDSVYCDAIFTTVVNISYVVQVSIPPDMQRRQVIEVYHSYKAGKYDVVFYTNGGLILDRTDFEVRFTYHFPPEESYCLLSQRQVGIEACDQFNIGRGLTLANSVRSPGCLCRCRGR